MEFACISCWTEFNVKDEDLRKPGFALKCPSCGYSKTISTFQKKEPEEEKKVEFRKPMAFSQKQKKAVKSETNGAQIQDEPEVKEDGKIQSIPLPQAAVQTGGEWLVKSISGLIYYFPSVYPLQAWASMLDSTKNFLVSRDGSIWKNLEEFLNYYKQTSNTQLSFERASFPSPHRASVVLFPDVSEKSQPVLNTEPSGELLKPEPPKPLTKQPSQFTFKIAEKKKGKYRDTLFIVFVFAAAIVGGTAILLLILMGL